MDERKRVPKEVQRLFWDVKKGEVDIKVHRSYIIRRVMDFGNMADIKWMEETYSPPEVAIDPGYTVIVVSTEGKDGIDDRGQMVVHWPGQGSVWDKREDTAFLSDPAGEIVDLFHYKGKRIRSSIAPSRRKAR